MKLLFFSLLFIGVAYAEVTIKVSVNVDAAVVTAGSTFELPCEYEVLPDEDQPPIIYWIKGASVDDPNAEIVFKGYRYWNETLGVSQSFSPNYVDRSFVDDMLNPTIRIEQLTAADEGRYWCMVAEWSGRQMEGTDAMSIALMIDDPKPYVTVNTTVEQVADFGNDVIIPCEVSAEPASNSVDYITWLEGPFHLADSENFTHTEIGTYKIIGTHDGINYSPVDPEYLGDFLIHSNRDLIILNAQIANSGRYWCQSHSSLGSVDELEIDRSSTRVQVTGYVFDCANHAPGLYPDPEDCSMYYECVASNPITYHRSCGYDGLVFHAAKGYCDWAANVPPPCGTSAT